MLLITAAVLMLTGLCCLWLSFEYLDRIDRQRAARQAPPPSAPGTEAPEPGPRLTRLGRPIEQVRLRA